MDTIRNAVKTQIDSFRGNPEMRRRLWMTAVGVLLSGFSVGMFQNSLMGLDPFQVFAHGLYVRFFHQTDFGTFYLFLNLAILIFDLLCLERHLIGIATFINMFLLGYVVDFSTWLWKAVFPQPGIGIRIFLLAAGLLVLCFASAMYFDGDLGVSTYDALALTMSERMKKIPVRFIRITTDICCVLIGVLCGFAGGIRPGIGTILTAFCMGPFIEFFRRTITKPLRRDGFRRSKTTA